MRLMAISGSLRRKSTNTALLESICSLVPNGIDISLCDYLSEIPLFSPDFEDDKTPEIVLKFAADIKAANGLVFASPEYAHGIPGALKNSLDWLVSRFEIIDKPAMIFHATERGDHAKAALSEVLTTMSMVIITEASYTLHLLGKTPEQVETIVARSTVREEIQIKFELFTAAIKETAVGSDAST